MIKKYHCRITPALDSKHFVFFSDYEIQHNLSRDRILNKWFYFYINKPVQPIIIWVGDNLLRLEPGSNRYIGTALRQTGESIPAIAIVEGEPVVPKEITILDFIEEADFNMEHKLSSDSLFVKWALGNSTTLNSNDWYVPAFKWIRKNLKYSWGLEYQNKTYFLNGEKKYFLFTPRLKETVRVEDHKNFESAVIHLFKKVLETETGINYDN